MSFRNAVTTLSKSVPLERIAGALQLPVEALARYLGAPEPASGFTPPERWEESLSTLAREHAERLASLASDLEAPDAPADAAFVVLRTHVKYVMWDDFSELVKLRTIHTYRSVCEMRLDPHPRIGVPGETLAADVRHFYALPGTATRRGAHFVINLGPGEEFEPHRDYAVVFGYVVEKPLEMIHPNEQEDSVKIQGLMGQDQYRLEIHLPLSRRFGPMDRARVIAGYADREELVPPSEYTLHVDPGFKNTDGTRSGTDVLRLHMKPPAGADYVRLLWPWSRSGERRPAAPNHLTR
jgi:hypothetical protein